MKCIYCKKTIADESKFCNFCGYRQEVEQEMNIEEMVESVQDKLRSITGHCFGKTGILQCKNWINDFGFKIVSESVEVALSQYLIEDEDGNYTKDSIIKAFGMIGGIANNKYNYLTKPYISDVQRILNYVKKAFRINYYELEDLTADLNNLLYYFFSTKQYDGKVEDILALVRGSKDKYGFFDKIELLKEKYKLD